MIKKRSTALILVIALVAALLCGPLVVQASYGETPANTESQEQGLIEDETLTSASEFTDELPADTSNSTIPQDELNSLDTDLNDPLSDEEEPDTPVPPAAEPETTDDSSEPPAEPDEEYELKQAAYTSEFITAFPRNSQLPDWTYREFVAGDVVEKDTGNVVQNATYAWYQATTSGVAIEDAQVLSTSKSYTPTYDLRTETQYYYLVKAFVGDIEVGSQIFSVVVVNPTTILLDATQNGEVLPSASAYLDDGSVTLKVRAAASPTDKDSTAFNMLYLQTMASTIEKSLGSAAKWSNVIFDGNKGKAQWVPVEGLKKTEKTPTNLNGAGATGTVETPEITIEGMSAEPYSRDIYCIMSFPATETNVSAAKGTFNLVVGPIRVSTDEAAESSPAPDDPTTEPSDGDNSDLPANWTADVFAQAPLTQSQSEALYQELIAPYHNPSARSDVFELLPAVSDSNGALSQQSQQSLLNLVNFIRRSGGVNMVQTIDPTFSARAQAGTDYLQATGTSGHYAADGSGNQAAIYGLHNSNLAWSQLSNGAAEGLKFLQLGQFYDNDSVNMQNLGHRRWLMDSRMNKIGFGYSFPTASNKTTNQATYVQDTDRYSHTKGTSFEAFPGVGAYPVELMDFCGWSLGIGDSGWTVNDSELSMKITREDGKSWDLQKYSSGGYMSTNNWFTVLGIGRGSGEAIMFRPTCIFPDGNYRNTAQLIGHTYTIEINGLYDARNQPRTIVYGTSFYSLAGKAPTSPIVPSPPVPTVAPIPVPTAEPTPVPTVEPTPIPTPVPVPTVPVSTPPLVLPVATNAPATTTSSASASQSTESASTSASAAPSAAASTEPLKPNPSASSGGVQIVETTNGTGVAIVGIPITALGDKASSAGTSVGDLEKWITIPEGASLQVISADGSTYVPPSSAIATGQVVRVLDENGRVLSEAQLVVKGDVLGTGKANLSQLTRLAAALIGNEPLHGVYLDAGDWTGDGRITLTDLVQQAQQYRRLGSATSGR